MKCYLALIGMNLVYACTSIFTKMASRQEALSWLIFKERITWKKTAAIAVIMAGVVTFFA